MPERLAKKVLLIGWDAADWRTITPLMDAGLMPSLEGLVNRGVMGNIATLDPPLSPMLWTSIATGKYADEHGILGFVEPDDDGQAVRPVLGTSRKAKAVWNILNQNGLRSNVVGWWPSHPAEPIRGAMVSNMYHRVGGPPAAPEAMPPGTVHPPELAETLNALRIHPQELTGNHLLPFVPLAAELPANDKGVELVAKTLAEGATVHQAATWLMEHTPWDFMAVYYDAIDHFGHGFMKYHPPQQPGIPDEAFRRYGGVVAAGYRFHDMMLGRLLELAGEDTTVILVSDHGFHSDHLRPLSLPLEPAGPANEHRDYGVFLMAGPSVRRDERVYGATLLDVAPTLLTLFDLPIGRDMKGRPLVTAFDDPPEADYVDSWEDIPGEDGQHGASGERDPEAERAAMRQLMELGYIEDGMGAASVDRMVRESRFYLARVLLSQGRYAEATEVLEPITREAPTAARFGLRLAEAYRESGRYADAHKALDQALEGHRLLLRERVRVLDRVLQQRAEGHSMDGQLPTPKLETRRQRFQRALDTGSPAQHYHRSLIQLAEDEPDAALVSLRLAREGMGARPAPGLDVQIGSALTRLGRWDAAHEAFQNALATDSALPGAYTGMARVHLHRGEFESAAQAALDAVGLLHFMPSAHFYLGQALAELGHYAPAAQAFEVALSQNPGYRRAHVYLAEIYRLHLGDLERATYHTRRATEMSDQGNTPWTPT